MGGNTVLADNQAYVSSIFFSLDSFLFHSLYRHRHHYAIHAWYHLMPLWRRTDRPGVCPLTSGPYACIGAGLVSRFPCGARRHALEQGRWGRLQQSVRPASRRQLHCAHARQLQAQMRRLGPRQQRVLPRAPVSPLLVSPPGRTPPANTPPPFPSSCPSCHLCPRAASPLTIAMLFSSDAPAALPYGLSCALTRSGHNKCFVNAVAGIRLPEGAPCTGHNQCENRCDKSQWVCGGATRSRRAIEADATHADDVEAVRWPGSLLTCPRCSCCCSA